MIEKNIRALSKDFMEDLLEGPLTPLLQRVLKDDTLCMELRGKTVDIYYRGGALYVVEELGNHKYKVSYNRNYDGDSDMSDKEADLVEIKTIGQAVEDVPRHKQDMDFYFAKHQKLEREFQQLIVRENNNSGKVTDATDYYILDIEYAFNGSNDCGDKISARYDMLAVRWPSEGPARKKRDSLPISFIEVKYGDGAMGSGTDLSGAGIRTHINDYIIFRKDNALLNHLANDMAKVFNQKHMLGLISSYPEKRGKLNISLSCDKPEFLLMLVNHDPAKSTMISEIKATIMDWNGKPESVYLDEIKVVQSSLVGHGLYGLDGNGDSRFKSIRDYYKEVTCENI